MKKIPTALVRNPDDRAHVLMEINADCEWVFAGEGRATRKWDGTCTMLDEDGKWWARREVKPGKNPPPNYVLEDFDDITGKSQGWEPIDQSSFIKAFRSVNDMPTEPGTYELIGPKINGNPEQRDEHALVRHGTTFVMGIRGADIPTVVATVQDLGKAGIEGIVWHHPDGRMAKLKGLDIE